MKNGIIRIGARIEPGDIIIGKITPKGRIGSFTRRKTTPCNLWWIAGDVKDASLKATPSLSGVVIDKRLFSKSTKEPKSKLADKSCCLNWMKNLKPQSAALKERLIEKLLIIIEDKTSAGVKDYLVLI